MAKTCTECWWSFLSRGIIAVLFGVAAILHQGLALELLVLLMAAFFFVDGVLSIIASFGARGAETRWWISLLAGPVRITIGIVAALWPQATLSTVISMFAGWALITGALEIDAAIRLRRVIAGEYFLGFCGIISLLSGVILVASPEISVAALVWILGIYGIFFGIFLLSLGFKLKREFAPRRISFADPVT
ncbi:MAG: HdeD family acid-resistance protein [Desulfobulbaceae bacterium]|nr:HdeD family acid-resistance protein [Desulfobulbaceae bacterium]